MIEWQKIKTVLLDMDGTLLDLHFDNYFWLTHLPLRYAEIKRIDVEEARHRIESMVRDHEGTLQWYCLEFWSETLDINIRQLKDEIKDKITMRPFARDFLERLRKAGKKVILITNAHPEGLELKLEVTAIDRWLDIVISSHEFAKPKEELAFWQALHQREPFDPASTLFIDDTVRILDSARRFGIGHLLCIHQPDSQRPRTIDAYPAIHHFDEIMPPVTG